LKYLNISFVENIPHPALMSNSKLKNWRSDLIFRASSNLRIEVCQILMILSVKKQTAFPID